MSNAHRQQSGPIYRSDAVKVISSRASKLIKGSGETNGTIRRLAQSVVNQFYYIVDPNLRLKFAERVVIARDMATEQLPELFKGITPKEIDAGMAMGSKALELSSKIQERESSFTKAGIHMRRLVSEHQDPERKLRAVKPFAHSKRGTNLATKPSPKQPYRRPSKAQRRNKAA